MVTPPGATHPGNRKWTELAYNKLAELGRCSDFKRDSLSNWAFVRMWCFTTILSLSSCCICPLAILMSSTCLFVYSSTVLLKRFPMWWPPSILSREAWAVKPYVSADPSSQPALISQRFVTSSEPRNITPRLSCSTPTQLLSSSFFFFFFLIAANNFHNYIPPALMF